ncbi:MAG: helix-turn-helix transcriptional regulator [Verrucomicrobiales bacterium]|nr:helix-turn-helix transcriptional regulator [Verrucomicrobiales bacterium]
MHMHLHTHPRMGMRIRQHPRLRITVLKSPMPDSDLATPEDSPGTGAVFGEGPAWKAVGQGWRPLIGGFRDLGFSVEWHDFQLNHDVDWARSFHPGSVELCLNLGGSGTLHDGQRETRLPARSLAFYFAGTPPLVACRKAGDRHQFVTVEFAPAFLARQFGGLADALHPLIREVVRGRQTRSRVESPEAKGVELTRFTESLRQPPVFQPAQRIWFSCKVTELAAQLFFQPAAGELFCTRTKRTQRERVERAQALLRENLQDPPGLEELARRVGCSHFYLSRLFSQHVGKTLQQYLREIRLERAAELLRTGQCNVTEAAMAVGYNSLSHFSTSFHEAYGCCPGLYSLGLHTRPNAAG